MCFECDPPTGQVGLFDECATLSADMQGNELTSDQNKMICGCLKVVLHRSHGKFFGVKVKTVKLVGGRRFLAARSGFNARTYSK